MSYLRFPTQPLPTWARFGRYGEAGAYGYQVDARGIQNSSLLLHEQCIPLASDLGLFVRLHLSSSVTVGNEAFEGLAPRHRGYALDGTYPNHTKRKVWDSNPLARGADAWFSEVTTDFVTWSPPTVEVPTNKGIDYVTFELMFKGYTGQWNIDSMQFRHTFAKNYSVSMPNAAVYLDSGLQEEVQTVYLEQPELSYYYVRYLNTLTVNVRKDQVMNLAAESVARGGCRDADTGFDLQSVYGVMVKMRIRGSTQEDIYIVAQNSTGYGYMTEAKGSVTPRAKNNYDRMQTMVFIRLQDSSQTPYRYIHYESVNLTLNVDDQA